MAEEVSSVEVPSVEVSSEEGSLDEQATSTEDSWSNLPEVPLQKIYKFLKRRDQFSLSLVCKTWAKEFFTCWQYFDFVLTESMLSREHCVLEHFAEKFGYLFQYVRIKYPYHFMVNDWVKHFKIFMQILAVSKVELSSFHIENLYYCIKPKNVFKNLDEGNENYDYEGVTQVIESFLNSQEKLSTLNLCSCQFTYSDAIRLLKLAIGKSTKLRVLNLQGLLEFINIDVNEPEDEQILQQLLDLKHLKLLVVDHRLILGKNASFHDVAKALVIHDKKLFLQIWLYAKESSTGFFQKLPTDYWKWLTSNSLLEVEVFAYTSSKCVEEMKYFFVKSMPLKNLQSLIFENCKSSLDYLFKYIHEFKYYKLLKRLKYDIIESIPDLVATIPIPSSFSKLELFEVCLMYPVDHLEDFLQILLEKLPESVETVFIEVSNIKDEGKLKRLMNKSSKYIPIFWHHRRIKFDVICYFEKPAFKLLPKTI